MNPQISYQRELLDDQFFDSSLRQSYYNFLMPFGVIRFVPLIEAYRDSLTNDDILCVTQNSLTNSEIKFHQTGLGFAFAGFLEISVPGDTTQIRQFIDTYLYNLDNPGVPQSGWQYTSVINVFTPPIYYIGDDSTNCGGNYGGERFLRWNEHCLNRYSSDVISHELGHMLTLSHTFPGFGDYNENVFSVIDSSHNAIDFLSDCPGENDSTCTTEADSLCDTRAESNPLCTQLKSNGIQYYVIDNNDVISPGGSVYVPNYESPAFQNDSFWGNLTYLDMDFNPVDPCLCLTTFMDCDGDTLDKPFETDGFYNTMSYAGPECPAEFTQQQVDKMISYLNETNNIFLVQDIVSNLYIMLNGDSDSRYNTFSTLHSAFEFISHDCRSIYRIFVKPDYVGVESEPIILDSNGFRNIIPGIEGRPIDVSVIGVSSVTGSNNEVTWIPALLGDIVVHQNNQNCKEPIKIRGRVDLSLYNVQFENFANGRQFGHILESGSVIDFNGSRLFIDNCAFKENGLNSTTWNSGSVCNGVVNFNPMQEPELRINDCLFTDNRSPGGPAVALCMNNVGSAPQDFATITQTTFANNFFLTNASANGVMHVQAPGNTLLKNCIFSGSDPVHGTPGNQAEIEVEYGDPREMGAVIENCLFDQEQWVTNGLVGLGLSNIIINHASSPGFVNPATQDYRLRWDSICLDKGSSAMPLDFDSTNADIGWSPNFVETEISGSVALTHPGNYKVVGSTVISGSGNNTIIPAGCVIKSDANHVINIRDTNDNGGNSIDIGNENGPRTAIVGPYVVIGHQLNSQEDRTDVHLNGVLFNLGSPDYSTGLTLRSCNIDLNGENDNIKFNNYDFSQIIFYSNCVGRFRNFDFKNTNVQDSIQHKMANLFSFYSDIKIDHVIFDEIPLPFGYKVCLYGTVPGINTTHEMSYCTINCLDNQNETYPVCINSATANLHHNDFQNIDMNGIYLSEASLVMSNQAFNIFTKTSREGYEGYPIIDGIESDCSMWCGKNSFKYDQTPLNYYFVTTDASDSWGYNYWGNVDCLIGIDPSDYLPQSIDSSPWFEECPNQGLFSACEDQEEEISLYELGKDANEIHNYPAALGYWSLLMQDYPESKYCNDAASTIKAIGVLTDYGEENYSTIRSCLESAAVASDSANALLSTYQTCCAWCVEGRFGDREGALSLLDSLYEDVKGNKDKEAIINTALAEIDAFPVQGQNSAMNLDGVTQATRLMGKLGALQHIANAKQGTLSSEPLTHEQDLNPDDFGIKSCFPNPYNPTTIIEVRVCDSSPLLLEVYNVLGQRIHVLHDGPSPIGVRRFTFNADDLGSGLYFVHAKQGNRTDVEKVMLVR